MIKLIFSIIFDILFFVGMVYLIVKLEYNFAMIILSFFLMVDFLRRDYEKFFNGKYKTKYRGE